MPLARLFAASFTERRSQVGLEWQGSRLTFEEIDRRATRMAHALLARGLAAGDRLAIYLPNRLEIIDLYLACCRLGVVFLPVNILYREREVDHILRDAEPRAIIAEGHVPTTATTPVWPVDELAREATAHSAETVTTRTRIDADTPAALLYTSGSTGPAKGALLSHGNLAANGSALIDAWRFTPGDRFLLALPLFHAHGLGNGLHCWLGSGARTRLLERFDAQRTPAEMLEFQTTVFFGVPTMYVRLLEVEPQMARAIGRAARLFVSGSAPLAASVFEAFRDRFGHAILERYGMTETLMTVSNPYDGDRRPGTVGLPLPGVETRIVNEEAAPVGDDVTGELWVRGPTVFRGYWRRPEATAAAFVEGFFRTGDLALRSADGYITLQGRRSDLIISGGFNIYPREIEELLLEHPCVAEAAVVGVPDRVRGEVPVAYVVARAGATCSPEALEAYCREKLASFKVPRAFVPANRLPRTALGKVQKHLLATSG